MHQERKSTGAKSFHFKPKGLIYTCVDSRVVTTRWLIRSVVQVSSEYDQLILKRFCHLRFTQAAPGDYFIVRNPGNLIPQYAMPEKLVPRSEEAAVELACHIHDVNTVVVCGHSDCKVRMSAERVRWIQNVFHMIYSLYQLINAGDESCVFIEKWTHVTQRSAQKLGHGKHQELSDQVFWFGTERVQKAPEIFKFVDLFKSKNFDFLLFLISSFRHAKLQGFYRSRK